jgi:hypothetical protein
MTTSDHRYPEQQAAPRRSLKVHTVQEIIDMEPPGWLIEDVLPERAVIELYGKENVGKTFLTVDWMASVATGLPWLGRTVRQGRVLYVVGEGAPGLGPRFRAWKQDRAFTSDMPVGTITAPVHLLNHPHEAALLNAIGTLEPQPRLIVIDTLARAMTGFEENSAKDMGLFVSVLEHLRDTFSATVLVLHHPGKRGDSPRGSGALDGAADTVLELKSNSKDGRIILSCQKQKDSEKFDPLHLSLRSLDLGVHPRSGKPLSSCVVDLAEKTTAGDTASGGAGQPQLDENHHTILAALSRMEGPASNGDIRKESGLAESTFTRKLGQLVKWGRVRKEGEHKAARYSLVDGTAGQADFNPFDITAYRDERASA